MTEKWEKDPEYLSYVEDLLATEAVQKLANYTQHVNSTRLEHSLSVSYYSYKLAKKWGCNARATARAGLLHDLFYYDWRTTKFDEGSHAYMHPRIAVKNAEKITELSDLERDIILKHMWGQQSTHQSTRKVTSLPWWTSTVRLKKPQSHSLLLYGTNGTSGFLRNNPSNK